MGIDPISLGLIGAGIVGGVSAYSVTEQNKAVRRAGRLREASLKVEADSRLEELAAQSRQQQGRVRASFGTRSGDSSAPGSATDVQLSSLNTALRSEGNINLNEYLQIAETRANTSANLQNPFIQGLMGGIQGFSAGYSFGQSFGSTATTATTSGVTNTGSTTFSGFAPTNTNPFDFPGTVFV